MCPRAFTADTNDYSLVTSLMRNKDLQVFKYIIIFRTVDTWYTRYKSDFACCEGQAASKIFATEALSVLHALCCLLGISVHRTAKLS